MYIWNFYKLKKKKIALTDGAYSYGLDEGKMHRERVCRGLKLDHRARYCWDSGLEKEAGPHGLGLDRFSF